MPIYDTPAPIDLAISWQVGGIDIIAGDRPDTVVTVSPTNPEKAVDRRAAEEITIDFDGGRLTIAAPRPRISWIGPNESVDLRVELPAGSRLTADIAVGAVRTLGRLGATRIKSSMGPVEIDATADLWMRAGHGNVSLASAEGGIEITADHGQVRVGRIAGDASVKASHGSILIAESAGELDAKLSYGDLEVTQALGSVSAKTAYGSIQLREVSCGSIQVESGFGQITIGVRPGVAAWLDLSSKDGRVRNSLDVDSAPAPIEDTVEVRARTAYSDITIERAR